MVSPQSYATHVQHLRKLYAQALETVPADGVLIFSGREQHYFGDDRAVPFQAFGHFCHWLPVNRPDQVLLIRPGEQPVYFQVVAEDFWYEQDIDTADWWAGQFDIVRLGSLTDIPPRLPAGRWAWLGEAGEAGEVRDFIKSLQVKPRLINPPALQYFLDYHRAIKTDYEQEQLRAANALALKGHEAAQHCFKRGGSEFDIHLAYLNATGCLEDETPYTNIVALDEKAAILHYQNKRRDREEKSHVLLIDAGARVNNYGSDITRTTTRPGTPELFRSLLDGMDALQLSLVKSVKPGIPYAKLHQQALEHIALLLANLGICRGGMETLIEQKIPNLFMPHGVGHLLGIQVHDVGGHQSDTTGRQTPPPEDSPMLRNTRTMEENMVFTVEPGCYFIPLLLEPLRDNDRGKLIDWTLVDTLYPCGGIRIEDNIRVTDQGYENLSRRT